MSVSTVTFARATDEQIIESARQAIGQLSAPELKRLPAVVRRLPQAKRPDVEVAGKFLWTHLCRNGGAS